MNHFDVIVIGAGPGGYSTAIDLSQNGLKVALIEKNSFDDTCVHHGCIPTKTLLSSVKKVNNWKSLNNFGFHGELGFARPSFFNMQKHFKSVSERLVNAIATNLEEAGVQVFHGEAKVVDNNNLEVNGETFSFDKLILATGSRSRFLDLKGFQEAKEAGALGDGVHYLWAENLPKTLAIIGGCPISVEFAYFFASLGVKVAILQKMETLTPKLDKSVISLINDELEELGVQIFTSVNVQKMVRDGEGFGLVFEQNSKLKKLVAEKYMLSMGCVINDEAFSALELVRDDHNSLQLRDSQQTSLDHVYAVGDVTEKLQFSNVAYLQSSVAIGSILNKPFKPLDLQSVPYAMYLNPEIAFVGATEQQLEESHPNQYLAVKLPASKLFRNHAENTNSKGFFKLLVEKESGKILGAHIALLDASIIINEIALAINAGLSVHDIAMTAHTHPTISEVFYLVGRAAFFKLSHQNN